ncbi:MAG: hypothetical protein AAFQ02_03740 [Bacteroidota bacterium]
MSEESPADLQQRLAMSVWRETLYEGYLHVTHQELQELDDILSKSNTTNHESPGRI